MDTEIDWRRELDGSFGVGPDVPVGHYVEEGRRAVRRRRRTALAAGLAAAPVVVAVVWGIAPGSGPSRSEAPVATDPTQEQADATADDQTGMSGMPWSEGAPPARLVADGIQVRDGAVVHERRDNLFPGKGTDSAALDISFRGERFWMTLEWDDGGGATTSARRADGIFTSFDAFVQDAVAGGGMTSEPVTSDDEYIGGLVQWSGGEIRPKEGVEVVRVVDDPLPSARDSLGLVLRQNGETTWMLITLSPGGSSASFSKDFDSGWATFDEWLADQVALAAGDEGLKPVELGNDGAVVAAQSGVEVLDQRADPDLAAYGTEAEGASSAVALLDWDGQRWFVLVIDDSVTTVAASKAPGVTTLDEFVSFMADRADEGGMR